MTQVVDWRDGNNTKYLRIPIDEELRRQLRRAVAYNDTTVYAAVQQLIADYVDQTFENN